MKHVICTLFQSVGQEKDWLDTFISSEEPQSLKVMAYCLVIEPVIE